MHFKKLFSIFLLGFLPVCSTNDIYDYRQHLAAKTPYRFVANKNESVINYKGCDVDKIWMVIRHGTRLPSKAYIHRMNTRLLQLQDQVIQNSFNKSTRLHKLYLDLLNDWVPSLKERDAKILTPEGAEEMIALAERMQKRFPKLLPSIYSNTFYEFRHTATQRTKESTRSFAKGLFGSPTLKDIQFPDPIKNDPILRFYKLCSKWRKEVKKNPEAKKENNMFKESPEVESAIQEVSEMLGFEKVLTFDDVHLMYMTCAFETAWYKDKLSPWCPAFSQYAIEQIEYWEDMKYYWIDGYGYDITTLQACPAIKNLVEFFENKERYPKAVLYFTHSGTILKTLAHLGLYRDTEALKHTNSDAQYNRKWRVGKIDCFGSNIAFILFRCDNDNKKKILLLHQERIVKLPKCKSDLCDFDEFQKIYSDSINKCNFDEMCSLK